MKVIRIICAILVAGGLVTFAFAIQAYRAQTRFIEDAVPAVGQVTGQTRHGGSGPRSSTWYSFRVRFLTAAGQPVEEDVRQTSSSPRFQIGQSVPLLYARSRPSDFSIDDFAMLWVDVVVLFTIAGAMLGAGGTAYWLTGGRSRGEGRPQLGRTAAKLTEIVRAWREGRLTRNSEFQPLLIALAFTGFPVLGGVVLFVLFAPGVVQGIVLAIILVIAFQVVRARRNG